jgi:hypothetical protein
MTAYQNITGSGYLNNPVRTVVIDRDNRPGSYPTHVSPIDLRRSETADLIRPFRDDLTVATPRAYATARVVFGDVLPAAGSTLTLTGLSNPVGPVTVSSVFEFQPLDVPASTPGARVVSLAGVLTTAPDPGLPGLTPKQLTRRRAAERLIEAVNAATGSLISARPGSAIGEVLLEQRVPGSAGNLSNSTTAPYLTVTSFSGAGDGSVRYPYGVQVVDGDPSLVTNELVRRVVRGVRSGTLDVPTSGRASLLDAPSDGHPYVAHSPFDETGALASFGISTGGTALYGTQAGLDDPFITRGSTTGSLDEPLGAKDKIEIDLTPVTSTSIQFDTFSGKYSMMYFNHATRVWEPIGLGLGYSSVSDRYDELDITYSGFSQGSKNRTALSSLVDVEVLDPNLRSQYSGDRSIFFDASWCSPIDTFGFPLHPKYCATGSQCFDAGLVVDRPFLIEKIVYQFSGSGEYSIQKNRTSLEFQNDGGIFFILNQRKANPDPGQEASHTNASYAKLATVGNYFSPEIVDSGLNSLIEHYDFGGIPNNFTLSSGGPSVYVDSVRDLVTFSRVGTIWPQYQDELVETLEQIATHPADFMDLCIEVPATGTMNGTYTIADIVKAPTYNPAIAIYDFKFDTAYLSKLSSTRNSIDVPTGRALSSEFLGPSYSYRIDNKEGGSSGITYTYAVKDRKDFEPSPYLIKPGDKLIFGWQSIMGRNPDTNGPGPVLTICPGAGKLILYGSYLQDDKPVHGIFKDQLNSDAAHETIPSGPWVLDRFESEPQMMYSSSMREEHVTGTMVTRRADGTLSVTNVNDLNIGGVRAVSARASDGDLGQRWSFFRNNRLFDSEEQYYDSMQPNPLDVLFSDTNVRAYGVPGVGYVPLMLPGETFFTTASVPNFTAGVNTYSNRSLFLRYPFQQEYAGIARVKKINSKVLTGKDVPAFISSGSSPDTVTLTTTQINSAILFFTGSTGTPGPSTLSSLLRPGGLTKDGTQAPNIGGYLFPFTSRSTLETNPTRAAYLPADPRVDDPDVNYWISRFMGCFGDGFLRMNQFFLLAINSIQGFTQHLIYRGTKHGLINPTPLFSNAVFNGTQFGQFRDLMEQRQYTRFSLADSSLTDAAVEVVFIDRSVTPDINGSVTNNIVTGSATNSSNVSPFATSEHPYDDALSDSGLIWDRDTPLPEEALAF